MTAPKPGDRVRVTFDAIYQRPHDNGGHIVAVDMPGYPGYWATVPDDAIVEVLSKPLQVGDTLTIGVDPEPPIGTVLIYPDSGEAVLRAADGPSPRRPAWRSKWSHMSQELVTVAFVGRGE
jgi:hypothetical protein